MTKNSNFNFKNIELSRLAKAFSHPARIAILKELSSRRSCVCGDIVDVLPLAQATVSQHLKELKEVGLIKGEVEGVKSCYCINWSVFESATSDFLLFFKEIISLKSVSEECC